MHLIFEKMKKMNALDYFEQRGYENKKNYCTVRYDAVPYRTIIFHPTKLSTVPVRYGAGTGALPYLTLLYFTASYQVPCTVPKISLKMEVNNSTFYLAIWVIFSFSN